MIKFCSRHIRECIHDQRTLHMYFIIRNIPLEPAPPMHSPMLAEDSYRIMQGAATDVNQLGDEGLRELTDKPLTIVALEQIHA